MSLVGEWRDRHSPQRGRGRIVWLVVILALVILFMLRAEEIVRTFTDVFFTDQSTGTTE